MQKRNISEMTQNRTPSYLASKLKVCAYIRVSTEHEKQLNSLENQRQYYERFINVNPEYEYCGIFSDAGISGAKENRPGFQSMLTEARNGRFNLIMTKSISRFARNTVLLLESVRELKTLGVGVFFEEHNINTLSSELFQSNRTGKRKPHRRISWIYTSWRRFSIGVSFVFS